MQIQELESRTDLVQLGSRPYQGRRAHQIQQSLGPVDWHQYLLPATTWRAHRGQRWQRSARVLDHRTRKLL